MIVPVAIFLAVNAGQASAHGWGTAMSTDTAFALGMLALVGRRAPDRMRSFLLTFAVVDDLAALAIIAIFYSHNISLPALLAGLAIIGVVLAVRAFGVRRGVVYLALGLAAWVAFMKSGVDPIVVGLVMGLLAQAYPAARGDLEVATEQFRMFREQPTPELARVASVSLSTSISPNDRLQEIFHPWTSYVIVPLFALANAGVQISGPFLARAFTSPVTLGIVAGYVAGKPLGIAGVSYLVTKVSKGRLRPPAGWASILGAGDHRRHRLYRVPAHRVPRIHRPGPGGGEGRGADRGSVRGAPHLGRASGRPSCSPSGPASGRCSARHR
jgi:Na+/H+ antiporter NhaA